MDKLLAALLSLHCLMAVYAVACCVVSGRNFGLSYPYPKNGDPIIKPNLTNPDSDYDGGNETDYESTREDRYQYFVAERQFMGLLDDLSSYIKDPRTWVMIPFLSTAATTAILAVAAAGYKGVYKTTTVINCNIALWLIHLSYMWSYVQAERIPDNLLDFWATCNTYVVSLHVVMLLLLSGTVALSGWYLRRSKVSWPRCNGLAIFTLGSLMIGGRLAYYISITAMVHESLGRGLSPLDDNHTFYCMHVCGRIAVPASYYFGSLAVMCFTLVTAVEAFLSHIWGESHREMSIALALLAGAANFIAASVLSSAGLGPLEMHDRGDSKLLFAIVGLQLFHAWFMWSCPAFMRSPPNILKLLCGSSSQGAVTEEPEAGHSAATGATEAGAADPSDAVPGCSAPEPSNEQSDGEAPPELQEANRHVVVERGRCLLTNIISLVLGLTSLGVLGVGIELSPGFVWARHLLVATMAGAMVKAMAAVITVVITGSPPVKRGLQLLTEVLFEFLLLLIGVIGSFTALHFTAWRTMMSFSLAGTLLALLLLILKFLDLTRASPVQNALRHLATQASAPASTVPAAAPVSSVGVAPE